MNLLARKENVMNAEKNKWGKIGGFKGAKLTENTDKDIANRIIKVEYEQKGCWVFFFLVFIITAILFAYCSVNENQEIIFKFAKFASFRGSLSGGSLFGAIITVLGLRGKIEIKK